jgi:hypothetical protein
MSDRLLNLAYEVELQPGEELSLPATARLSVGAGRWVITIRPAECPPPAIRSHDAFLNSYAPEDEGLYDDLPR